MIDGLLFDNLEQIGRFVCDRSKPFGGIQVSSYIIYIDSSQFDNF